VKLFWGLILLLVLGAVGLWLAPGRSSPATGVDAGLAAPEPATRPAAQTPAPVAPPMAPVAAAPASVAPPAVAPVAEPASESAVTPATVSTPAPAPAPTPATANAPSPSKAAAEAVGPELKGLIESDAAAAPAAAPIAPAVEPPAPPKDRAAAPAKLEKQDDGSVLVDGRFSVRGSGTKDDPYRVPWEMLVSSQESYQPRLGRKVIPERIKMLDGKFVKITGYIAFPIMAQSQDEMLMMLNQWDGCCIGVPPTPYDAVEVKLRTPAQGDERMRMTGTVSGVLRVDPYLVKDWLVSLYLMDDAVLSDAAGTQPAKDHSMQ
jgi:hypothetical protein